MSTAGRPDPKVVETYELDFTKLPVGTKFKDENGSLRVVRSVFFRSSGNLLWASKPRHTSRGLYFNAEGQMCDSGGTVCSGRNLRIVPESIILPDKNGDGKFYDLTWLPMGTRFCRMDGVEGEVSGIDPALSTSSATYPMVTNLGIYTVRGFWRNGDFQKRGKYDIRMATIVLPKRERLPGEAPKAAPSAEPPGVAAAAEQAALGHPGVRISTPRPVYPPGPTEPKKNEDDIDITSWDAEW